MNESSDQRQPGSVVIPLLYRGEANECEDEGGPVAPSWAKRTARPLVRPFRKACILAAVCTIIVVGYLLYWLLSLPFSLHISSTADQLLPSLSYGSTFTHIHTCDCPPSPDNNPLYKFCATYGPETLARTRIHTGTNYRIDQLLAKAKRGEGLVLSLMGGSVSACHGVDHDSMGRACYSRRILDWFDERFPVAGGHVFVNGAIGGMDSSYYAFCGTHHIPQNVDLVILEFDVNDQRTGEWLLYFDQLLRVILEMPSHPAVLILGVWGPILGKDYGFVDPQHAHLLAALYHDVPYISLKQLIWSHFIRFPSATSHTFYSPDFLHPNARGHRILSDLVTSYLATRLCILDTFGPRPEPYNNRGGIQTSDKDDFSGATFATLSTSDSFDAVIKYSNVSHNRDNEEEQQAHGPLIFYEEVNNDTYHFLSLDNPSSVPPVPLGIPLNDIIDWDSPDQSLSTFLDSGTNPIGKMVRGDSQPRPFCADANDPLNPLVPTEVEGWKPWAYSGEKHYWIADEPRARIRVDIDVNEGRVAVFFFRSAMLSPGVAYCWVDDNETGRYKLEGHWGWETNVPAVAYIDHEVTPGKHYVTCELSDESAIPEAENAHHFRIVAIMAT